MKKIITVLLFIAAHKMATAQSVGIGTTTPNSSAQLDVTSTTKGMLIPRMAEAEKTAILSPVQGLMIFNTTTNSFQYYNGVSWVNISHSGIISGTANKVAKFNSPWGLTAAGLISDNGAGVAINTTNALPNSSALLDMTSTGKGILIPRMLSAERTAIVAPATGLLVFDNTTNSFWFYNSSAWTELSTSGGTNVWTVNGTNISYTGGAVGIGTSTPLYPLDVVGNSRFTGWVAINDPNPDYPLDVNGLASIQYVGVGGAIPNSTYPLDVLGNARFQNSVSVTNNSTILGNSLVNGNMTVNNNGIVDGTLTVNNGKGVAYNPSSAANLKIYPFTTGTLFAVLNGFALSAETSIGFVGGGFTNTPRVMVGDIDVTGGTVGELYRVQLILYGCDNNSCKARLLNTSPNPVNYSITWNCVAIGN
jgi:hypothetical protein